MLFLVEPCWRVGYLIETFFSRMLNLESVWLILFKTEAITSYKLFYELISCVVLFLK